MELQVFDVEQGTPEWHECRIGIPTASEFHCLLVKGRGPGGVSATRTTYLRTLAGEILTGEIADSYSNEHMERGHALEDEARSLYAMVCDASPQRVGFLRRGRVGCSPDSLVGNEGLLEIKTKLPKLQIEVLEDGEVPAAHIAQLQGQLLVSGRQWVDFVSYWPGLPPFIKRVERDEPYIAALKFAVDDFLKDLDALVERIQHYKAAA